MKIYGSSFSPYARKILAFCGEAGIDYELQAVGLGSDDPEFLAASPLRKIPAMEDDGFTLADSSAICHYLEAKHDVGLIPHDPALLGKTVWWDEVADTELFGAFQPLFFNRVVAPLFLRQEADEAAAARAEEGPVPKILAWLETQMPEDGDWLVGERLTLADLKGQPVLLNVWATWCVACRAEHGFLMDLAERGSISIFGINYKDERNTAIGWLGQLGDPYQANIYDSEGILALDLGVYGAPETFLLDASGIIKFRHVGPLTPDVWRDLAMHLTGQ